MLAALFVFGGLGFWVLAGIAMFVLLALVEYERSGWTFFTIISTAALMFFCGNAGILPWFAANPLLILGFLAGYTVTGACWSLFKWALFVKDRKEKFLERKVAIKVEAISRFKSENEGKEPSDGELFTAMQDLKKRRHYDDRDVTRKNYGMPVPSQHKGRIIHWMAFWPWSVINSLIFDFIRRFFKHIYNLLADVYRKISENIYKDVIDETGDDAGH